MKKTFISILIGLANLFAVNETLAQDDDTTFVAVAGNAEDISWEADDRQGSIRCDSVVFAAVYTSSDEPDSLYEAGLRRQLRIELYLNESFNRVDTVKLVTWSKMFPPFGPRNCKAELLDETGKVIRDLESTVVFRPVPFDRQVLMVNVGGLDGYRIRLSYDIVGTVNIFRHFHKDNLNKVEWFSNELDQFVPPSGVVYDRIAVRNDTDGTVFLSSCRDNKNVEENLKDVQFVLVDTNEVVIRKHVVGDVFYSIYLIDSPTLQKFEKIRERFNAGMEVLLAGSEVAKSFDIVTACWNIANVGGMGRGFGNFILCDTSFASSTVSLIHESIHILYPFREKKASKAKYFIGESLVEWVAHYVVFGRFSQDMSQFDFSETSLYEIDVNNSKTFNYLYNKGPHIIQQFADNTDPALLKNAILHFFILNKNTDVGYEHFLQYLSNFFPEEEIRLLDERVKNKSHIE
ncbi:MAG: hypothetical protein LBG28_00975 [Tannerella sp.]|jgi:hypothetical protein|nr:hypothetical protein [Tannerella sp.]